MPVGFLCGMVAFNASLPVRRIEVVGIAEVFRSIWFNMAFNFLHADAWAAERDGSGGCGV